MGLQTFKELISLGDKVFLKILIRNSTKNQSFIKKYKDIKNIQFIFGDLRNYSDILKGVQGSDYILHVGGMVSPYADDKPKITN